MALRRIQVSLRLFAICASAMLLSACGDANEPAVVEIVAVGPLRLAVDAEGTLNSAKSTPLLVPGQGWAERRLLWMRPEGSSVAKGELLARFSTERGDLDLAQALIELERNALARAAKQGEQVTKQGQVAVDLSQVAVQLGIAQRYADADLSALARNEVLDAIEDVEYLDTKRTILRWKQSQARMRGTAEGAVLDAQRATLQTEADRQRTDLKALELHAPHAGVMMLSPDWSGEKPAVGSRLHAGFEFGRFPDIDALEVELSLPQLQAQGIKVGNAVELSPVGRPGERVRSKVSWVASAAKVVSRDSPVKVVSFKAPVPSAEARRFGWMPGQRMRAQVVLFEGEKAIGVPNVALRSDSGKHYVRVRNGSGEQRRAVRIGARDGARSQVLSGLSPGDEIVLVEAGAPVGTEAPEDEAVQAGKDPRKDASGSASGETEAAP